MKNDVTERDPNPPEREFIIQCPECGSESIEDNLNTSEDYYVCKDCGLKFDENYSDESCFDTLEERDM